MEAWQMNIDSEPQILQGKKVDAGKLVMGKVGNDDRRNDFDIETC